MKKKLIVIFSAIFAFLAVTFGAFFITRLIMEKESAEKISDADFLVSKHVWKKVGTENVIWTFESDGSCKISTNGTETFDCDWNFSDEKLHIKTAWLYELDDTFEFSLDKDAGTFKVVGSADGKESTFAPSTL